MTQFRKRPIIIEAYQFTRENIEPTAAMPAWFAQAIRCGRIKIFTTGKAPTFIIETLEGPMTAGLEDWAILGAVGEIYACRSDVFEITYEPVTASSVARMEPIS